jgi:tetratricopeptide (TPR) repeat protein
MSARNVAWALVPAVFALLRTRLVAGRKTRSQECERCTHECVRHGSVLSEPCASASGRAWRIAACTLFVSLLPLAAAPQMSFEEAEALIEAGKYVKVLDYALDAVRRNPESFEGQYLLGMTLHRGEGNLPLAQYRLEQAKRIVTQRGGYRALPDDRQKAYLELLQELLWIYGESEQYQRQLDLIAAIRIETGLDLSHEGGWAMMKLGRYDEARALLRFKALSENPSVRATAMNTLGAIESTTGNLQAGLEWFSKLVNDEAARKATGVATVYSNRAEVEVSLLRFGSAESDWQESTKHFASSSYTNPWSDLTLLYTGEGKLPLAIQAAHQMRDWDHSSDATIEQHRWNLNTRMIASLLMAAGHDKPALDLLEMVLSRPDRQGSTTSDPVEAEICLLTVYDEALRTNREREMEGMSWSRPSEWFGRLWNVARYTVQDWGARSRLRALIMKTERLDWVLRPYSQDSTIPEWTRPAITAALGEGMSSSKLQELLKRNDETGRRERPYVLEVLGESQVRTGSYRRGIESLNAALQLLPQEEVLLKARAHALLAEALDRSGQTEAARAHYVSAFDLDPRVFRALGLTIPVRVHSDNDASSRAAASWLKSSPRFRSGNAFVVEVARSADGLEATLEDPTGTVLGRAGIRWAKEGGKESAWRLYQEAQQKFFQPRINQEQADLNSLDGSTLSGDADTVLER